MTRSRTMGLIVAATTATMILIFLQVGPHNKRKEGTQGTPDITDSQLSTPIQTASSQTSERNQHLDLRGVENSDTQSHELAGASAVAPNQPKTEKTPISAHKSAVDSTAEQDNQSRAQKRAERVMEFLQKDLSASGFSQNEIDIAASEIANEFRRDDKTIRIGMAVDKVAGILSLTSSRKKVLNDSAVRSFSSSVAISFEQIELCLRARSQNSSRCVKEISENLAKDFSAVVVGESITEDEFGNGDVLKKAAVNQAVKQCGESAENLNEIFDISLAGCN